MPIIVKAQGSDSTLDVIKKFKKATAGSNVIVDARERAYYRKPSQVRAVKKIEMKRLRKRSRSLKKMKNISPQAIQRINDRLSA